MATTLKTDDRVVFEDVVKSFEAQIANIGVHLTVDSTARLAYAREIKVMADKLRQDATRGKITWAQAAQQAQDAYSGQRDRSFRSIVTAAHELMLRG